MKKLCLLGLLLIVAVFLISCGDDDDGGTAGGSGVATVDPNKNVAATEPASAATDEAAAAATPQGAPAAGGSNNFSLLFVQETQPCASCGIWFDSAQLVINHSAGTFTKSKSGGLLIKLSSGKLGTFQADLSSIPASATIQNATLYMHLNTHEGIANSDNSSVITAYDTSGGSRGAVVRTITAAGDIKGKGYSKSNPNVPIDFTAYAQQVHGQ